MRARAAAAAVRRLSPATVQWPLEMGNRPQSMRKVVVLPAPLAPSRPKISPLRTRKLTRSTAVKLPKRRTRLSAAITSPPPAGRLRCCSSMPVGLAA